MVFARNQCLAGQLHDRQDPLGNLWGHCHCCWDRLVGLEQTLKITAFETTGHHCSQTNIKILLAITIAANPQASE